ncbi:hypothetical protein GBA52_002292 [Prunus armeniaca]|nr:hypothetical protein GBA52_002292 [Prunus armeniaca]
MGAQDFWVVIIVIGFCFQAHVSSSQNLTCNPNDLKALEDFMKGIETVIEGWGNNLSSNCCEWAGITCNSSSSLGLNDSSIDTYRVVKLELPKKRLAGNLSESLGMLDQLRTLNLSHNFLKHSLPIPLFHLPNLELLDLSSNDFSGPIPADIDLPSIQFLEISQNFLNGSLPPSICNNSTQLRALKLAVNYFTGDLPPGLGNCISLEDLCLGMNTFTGGVPEGIFRLQKLTRLNIQDNKLSGQLSKEIGNLINLVRLDISTNGFSGTIPDVFDSLGRLQYFVAHSNNFSGQIPPSLASSPTLSLLNARNNSLEGSIDLDCSAMTSLASIDLGSNRFYGPIPSNLPSCRHLNNINIARNNFSGQIPESFKNFHSLSYLSLSNSSISNISSALKILQHCQNLTTLVLTLNFRDEELPADPTLHFEKLKVLIIANCRLTGSIPQWLSSSSRLQLLDLSWNRLEGTIPVWFGNFSNLFYLDLSNNSFTGEIPRSITGLRSLIDGRISIQEPSPDFPLFMKRNVSNPLGQSRKSRKNRGVIVGIAVGIVFGTAVFLTLMAIIVLRVHSRREVDPEKEEHDSNGKDLEELGSKLGDVYSFGVVLLELLTGKRPMDMCKPRGCRDLISWAFQMKREKRETEVFDPFIYEKKHDEELLCVFEIACLCLSGSPKVRPSTQQLVSWLDNISTKN